jgi:hypothetical protein
MGEYVLKRSISMEETLGDRIRAARKQIGTLEVLFLRTGIRPTHMSNIENNRTFPRPEDCVVMAKMFGWDHKRLLTEVACLKAQAKGDEIRRKYYRFLT